MLSNRKVTVCTAHITVLFRHSPYLPEQDYVDAAVSCKEVLPIRNRILEIIEFLLNREDLLAAVEYRMHTACLIASCYSDKLIVILPQPQETVKVISRLIDITHAQSTGYKFTHLECMSEVILIA